MSGKESLRPLAELYAMWALNPLIEIVHVLAHDLPVRPQNYRELGPETATLLSDFRFKYGAHPDWPDTYQRTLNFKVLCQVSLASPAVRAAALAYIRNKATHPDPTLLAAFQSVASGFRAQLKPLEGAALKVVVEQTRAMFDRAVKVLQDPMIARAFGAEPPPVEGWPTAGNFDGAAAYYVAQVIRGLVQASCLGGVFRRLSAAVPSERRLVPRLRVSLPQDKFVKLQQAAHWGSLTISRLLEDDLESIDHAVVTYAYQWTGALQRLIPDVQRAWKDLEYRARLTDLEWGLSPNPAGDTAVLVGGGGLGVASTYTVEGEVCCCSGDLDCDPTSQLSDFCSEYQCPTVATLPERCA